MSAEDVIDFVFFLLVIANPGAWFERTLTKDKRKARRFFEERVANRLTAAVVGAGLGGRDLGIAFENVSAGCGLLPSMQGPAGAVHEQAQHKDLS